MGPVDGFSSDPLTAATAAEARSQASSAVSKVAGLEEDVHHLLMVVESLWEMLIGSDKTYPGQTPHRIATR